ncbi:rhodanese-like domain-containing protein [Acuticoccus sp. I52.16.1]|uniref:rhodanese-like domain-containing protein n=1 Tax=Acuticoccus sp. I52.16.1 TaxID=2928472 RepID=UPI001FD2B2A9|nr:rhodanese-like domain-containing protein [Acuticoccus sp. I52.16.1]UOM36946.1 rhodanese-like domain-containing protein [Acuticoccus sp. I52.16.1]
MMQTGNPPISEVTPDEAYNELMNDPSARLVDVRTKAEWAYVGLPDLTAAPSGEPVLLEWQVFPTMAVADDFGQSLQSACPDPSTALYFICRSGARSLAAARLMGALGYERCFNVTDGFEGPPDGAGHRGTVAGWKASGLPWRQT